ncbi:pseudouridine synthase [Rubrivivax sp. RP6-9]|uniref:pseudouridine synthase n=1 Tax=Rubrivivax sp. RP6-9 TaxID=3415750 RepID=UPI003CC5A765
MNPNDADSPSPEPTTVDAPPADDQTTADAAPKRKRAPRKKAEPAAAVEPAGADASAPAEAVGAPADAAPAPVPRKRTRRAPAADTVAAADAQPLVALSTPDLAPAAEPVAAPRQAAEPTAVPQTSVEPGTTHAAEAAAEPASGAGDDAGPANAAETGAAPEGGKRSRNRRRGRRGGDRGDRPPRDGAMPAEGQVAGADDATDAETEADGAEARPVMPKAPPPDVGEVFAQVLSGAYDAEPADEEIAAVAPKRVLAAEPDAPKLHKVLAQAGVGSRRDMEQMIVEGRITVNGEPAHIGQRISFGDRIAVGGKPVRVRIAPPPPRVLAYHKPAGEVVTHDDPQQRPTVFRRLPRLQQGKWQSVGRLDINTEGLLLFTNSGELANQLMHPRFGVEREYAVRSLGVLGEEAKARLLEGVDIDGQPCAFKSIEDGGGEGANHWYRCVITEGRNREVRKLFEAVGHAVSRLIRIRYGSVVLPRGLKRGVWVDLDDADVRSLRRQTGIADRPERGERGERPDRGEKAADGDRRNRRGGKGGRNGPADRGGRGARGPRPDGGAERVERAERPDRPERGEGGAIPNPLQQTYDRRAIQLERQQRREIPEDGPIPNPLQQTYDKRALQRDRQPVRDVPDDGPIPNPLQQTYDKRFAQPGRADRGLGGGGGGGNRGGARGGRPKKAGGGGGGGQPDPLKTAVGYIGGDAFLRKGGGGGGGRGGSRGGRSGGGGGGGGGGRGRR